MAGASHFPALNLAYGGRLCETLQEWQSAGMTLGQIQVRIAEEQGWSPGRSTLGRWMQSGCGDE